MTNGHGAADRQPVALVVPRRAKPVAAEGDAVRVSEALAPVAVSAEAPGAGGEGQAVRVSEALVPMAVSAEAPGAGVEGQAVRVSEALAPVAVSAEALGAGVEGQAVRVSEALAPVAVSADEPGAGAEGEAVRVSGPDLVRVSEVSAPEGGAPTVAPVPVPVPVAELEVVYASRLSPVSVPLRDTVRDRPHEAWAALIAGSSWVKGTAAAADAGPGAPEAAVPEAGPVLHRPGIRARRVSSADLGGLCALPAIVAKELEPLAVTRVEAAAPAVRVTPPRRESAGALLAEAAAAPAAADAAVAAVAVLVVEADVDTGATVDSDVATDTGSTDPAVSGAAGHADSIEAPVAALPVSAVPDPVVSGGDGRAGSIEAPVAALPVSAVPDPVVSGGDGHADLVEASVAVPPVSTVSDPAVPDPAVPDTAESGETASVFDRWADGEGAWRHEQGADLVTPSADESEVPVAITADSEPAASPAGSRPDLTVAVAPPSLPEPLAPSPAPVLPLRSEPLVPPSPPAPVAAPLASEPVAPAPPPVVRPVVSVSRPVGFRQVRTLLFDDGPLFSSHPVLVTVIIEPLPAAGESPPPEVAQPTAAPEPGPAPVALVRDEARSAEALRPLPTPRPQAEPPSAPPPTATGSSRPAPAAEGPRSTASAEGPRSTTSAEGPRSAPAAEAARPLVAVSLLGGVLALGASLGRAVGGLFGLGGRAKSPAKGTAKAPVGGGQKKSAPGHGGGGKVRPSGVQGKPRR